MDKIQLPIRTYVVHWGLISEQFYTLVKKHVDIQTNLAVIWDYYAWIDQTP